MPVKSHRVSYRNESGEEIRAIMDTLGDPRSGIHVVIPPAWGRTKESTLGLAETILQTFYLAGEPVSILRFDGIRRRGESHNEPDCVPPVGENLRYTFSQGVRDIQSTLDFLERARNPKPRSIFIASFSIASVEARRAIAEDAGRRIGGWVSIVGAVDPQSMIRVVSGGIDYFAGASDGLEFGAQYIQGLLLNVDLAARDAIECGIAFLDDARRDMARIDVPVTWLAGAEDAWTSGDRLLDMLSVGDCSRRKLIELPIGHQLRSSRQAVETFELAAVELAAMALKRDVASATPSRRVMARRRRDERSHVERPTVDIAEFWKDYLVGRDGSLGIELMSATSAYRALMDQQISALVLESGCTVVDVGSGAGAFPLQLGDHPDLGPLKIVEVDLVIEGLRRCGLRLEQAPYRRNSVEFMVADLDDGRAQSLIPLADASADAVLLSLIINYVKQPTGLLREAARLLRPGGRLVVSGMREDADVSKICVAGAAEIRSHRTRVPWESEEGTNIDRSLQEFISSGARILDLEEFGRFRFWGPDGLRRLIGNKYFTALSIEPGYGDPPQAWVAAARRNQEPIA